jgi:DNA-binding transcriptional ArsR family regulator
MTANESTLLLETELLDGSYDCVDRLVLRAYFPLVQSPGGMRAWWRRWHGSDDRLDDTNLMRLAGRFGRRVRAWAEHRGVPIVFAASGQRKDELAESSLPRDRTFRGVFLIVVGRAPASVWHVQRTQSGSIRTIERKRPYVNHYAFHIMDDEWGHLIIRFCPHPPFGALVLLNGHEYVARQAQRAGVSFIKEGNCFTTVSDATGLDRVAETLSSSSSAGRLARVCERWIYSAVLCFALDLADQERTGFRYRYSVFQAEYSRNLLFTRGSEMDQVFSRLIERTRARLEIRSVRTLFGRRHRPKRSRQRVPREEVALERSRYDLTVFKVHSGQRTLKVYSKGERVLRIEAIVHNARDLPCGTGLDKLPAIVAALRGMADRFVEVLDCVDTSFVAAPLLDTLPEPSQVGRMRVGGLDLNRPRSRAVLEAVLALSPLPEGFTASALAERVRPHLRQTAYAASQAAYDLRKLRGKGLIEKLPKSRRYRASAEALRTMAALLVLREHVIAPVLAGAGKPKPGRQPKHLNPADQQYRVLHREMRSLFAVIGIAA